LTLVVLIDAIPNRFVAEPIHDAIVDGTITQNSYSVGFTGGRVDGFSECKRMTVGLGAPEGMSTFESAVRSPTLGPCETAVPKIIGWAQGTGGLERSYDYYRYWNGSAVVLRPTVAAFGVAGTRMVAAMALIAVTIAFAVTLGRRVGRGAAVMSLAPLLLTTDYIDLPGALLHAIGMIVAVGGAALMLRWLRPDSSVETYAAAAFTAGAASLFFADLTNPDASWALVACSAAVVAVGAEQSADAVRRSAASAIGWIVGFTWMWASKWLIASFVLGFARVSEEIRNKTEERLNADVPGVSDSRFEGLRRAWREWWNEPLIVVVVVVLVVIAALLVSRQGDLASTWQRRLLIGAPAAIPFCWHVVMRQHTVIHSWFTYRSFAVAFGIILLALTARLKQRSSEAEEIQEPEKVQANVGSGGVSPTLLRHAGEQRRAWLGRRGGARRGQQPDPARAHSWECPYTTLSNQW
jgi:hypothetical protein